MMRKKIFIYYHEPCGKRRLDANRLKEYFIKNNFNVVNTPKGADIIFFITCAAVDIATQQTLKMIAKFQKMNGELIIAGCLPEIEKEKLAKVFQGRTISTKDLEKIDELFPENVVKFRDIDDANFFYQQHTEYRFLGKIRSFLKQNRFLSKPYVPIRNFIFRRLLSHRPFTYSEIIDESLYYVRISAGCLGSCSYCSINKAIGRLKSKPIDLCIKEFQEGLHAGHKKIVLAADDTGAYGVDIGKTFPELLDSLTSFPNDYQIIIRSLHPQWIIKYKDQFNKLITQGKIIQLGIPIQSGNNRILKLMHRYPDTKKMIDIFLQLQNLLPNLSINTHCIVGFPTETEEEFHDTLQFLLDAHIAAGYVYPFSCKPRTEAELIEPKISSEITRERLIYAKKFLKQDNYHILQIPGLPFFIFEKKDI